ncbi:integrase [Apibacter muscae]|uniref:tyrosine-type recombinase/integrase n=1 Tax=Apibacter muscae TaxID=2509004 RepID=UPI0011AD20C9|nr:tyrosine-type recombinase/integrase [Apibacter muscae]TWP23944.1 integrase [Apibacter muscae]
MHNKFISYLKLEKNYSDLTIKSYERDLLDLINYLLEIEGVEDIKKVQTKHLRNFIINLSKKHLSEKTINRKISTIRSYFKFLLKIELINENPVVHLKNIKSRKIAYLPYTENELLKLNQYLQNSLENSDNNYKKILEYLIFRIFYETGIRRIELINIKTSQINFNNSSLKILGKRNKERIVPLSNQLLDLIYLFINKKYELGISKTQTLLTDMHGQILKEKYVYYLIRDLLNQVTTKENKSPHMLRHSFATHLLNNGANLNVIKDLLGHSSLAATQIYTHNSIEELKKSFNKAHPLANKNRD